MRAVVQRITCATVEVDGRVVARSDGGFLVFVGVRRGDGSSEAQALANKVANLRIVGDGEGKANLSLLEIGGTALVVSQFTLLADCRRGRRPSFSDAADPPLAEALVGEFTDTLERAGVPTASGIFGAHMVVSLVNDGPYTIVLDTEELSSPRRANGARTHHETGDPGLTVEEH
jgi:D-tyrosyl-tRNA(Tyr) deacylase